MKETTRSVVKRETMAGQCCPGPFSCFEAPSCSSSAYSIGFRAQQSNASILTMTYYPRILNRVLSQALTTSRQQRSMSHSLKAVPDAANVEDLRALAGPTFAKPDFRDIQWAEVFGSFARGPRPPKAMLMLWSTRKR